MNFKCFQDKWDVSKVETMESMFEGATSFNGDVSGWKPGLEVTAERRQKYRINLSRMFAGATEFTGNGMKTWDVSKVRYMKEMFKGATKFTGEIGKWDVAEVKDFDSMFADATAFNSNLKDWRVGDFSPSSIDMSRMFQGATSFEGQGLDDWKFPGPVEMESMFEGPTGFRPEKLEWKASKFKNVKNMFKHATSFNAVLLDWELSAVLEGELTGMFHGASAFNQDLSGWIFDETREYGLKDMFNGATAFEGKGLDQWDIKVKQAARTFKDASKFNNKLEKWHVSALNRVDEMFDGATGLQSSWIWKGLETLPRGYDTIFKNGRVQLETVLFQIMLNNNKLIIELTSHNLLMINYL